MQEKQQKQCNENTWNKWQRYIPYFVVVLGVILTGIVYLISMEYSMKQNGIIIDTTLDVISSTNEEPYMQNAKESISLESQIQETKNYVFVYVCGAVIEPGVYSLVEGSRLVDAIHAAGGFADDAWQEGINLARVVVDAEQIYVATEEEHLLGIVSMSNASISSESSNDNGKINLNTATKEQLMTLPGIGEAKAESILAYRQQNGAFSCIEDIMNISGIKETVFDKIKEFITV